jgi:hypothetical protein
VQHLLGRQRVPHRPVEPGNVQLLGEPFMGAGHEPGRHRRPQQRGHQHRGAFHRHVPRRGQQDRGRVHVHPIRDSTGLPKRHLRRGGLPAATTRPARQHIVDLLQPHRRDIPHLRPRRAHLPPPGQILPAPRTFPWRRHGLGPVRRHLRNEPRALPARLTTRPALLRPHPLRPLSLTFPLGGKRILRRRSRRVRRINTQLPPQRGVLRTQTNVLRLQSLNPGDQTLNQSSQLVIRPTTHPSLLHTKIISRTREPTHTGSPANPQVKPAPEWTPCEVFHGNSEVGFLEVQEGY